MRLGLVAVNRPFSARPAYRGFLVLGVDQRRRRLHWVAVAHSHFIMLLLRDVSKPARYRRNSTDADPKLRGAQHSKNHQWMAL